ncbi:hypothetical protein [Arenimonas sp.]|uniref:hypothetical protein n=1 Tax=Arenimonas sp. TaxID=1872635 RepID=UPI0039E4BC92
MPRINFSQCDFTAGEMSPRMYMRSNVARYNSALKRAINVIIQAQGGAVRRPGTDGIADAKFGDKRCRLIPYVFTVSQAYQLEFGDYYMRVHTASGEQIEASPGVPYEIATPYTFEQAQALDFCQGGDTMFLWHPNVYPQRVQRFGHADWRIMNAPFDPEPFDELGLRPPVDLTLSSPSIGAGVTFTASGAAFLASDVGRDIEIAGGIATITGYTSTTVVTCTIKTAFGATSYVAGDWLITGSPQATCTPSAKDPVGATITLTLGAAGWRSDDVGKFVNLNAGLCRITGYTSATVVDAEIRRELSATVAAPPNAWFLARSMWGLEFGYPRTGALHSQCLWPGGSPAFPQGWWKSSIGLYYDFEIGVLADAATMGIVNSDQANPIRHMASSRALAVLTEGNEFTLRGTDGGPISPGAIDVQNQTSFGCNDVAPVRIGSELLFVSLSGLKVRAMAADRFDASNFAAPSITDLAEHITQSGIVDMDRQIEPEPLLWCVRADGKIALCTLDRDNEVVAWVLLTTDGAFESISVVPYQGVHWVWAVVRREAGGVTRRSIERFNYDRYMDCSVLGVASPAGGDDPDPTPVPTASWEGLEQYEGKTVDILADGMVHRPLQVVDGAIELDRPATTIEIGLHFEPLVETLRPDLQNSPFGTTIFGLPQSDIYVDLMFKDTVGCTVNGRAMQFRSFNNEPFNEPIQPYSGLMRIEQLADSAMRGEAELVITQPDPLPFHLLGLVRRLEVNDG